MSTLEEMTRGIYFDRKGREMPIRDALEIRMLRPGYERVGLTWVGGVEVSTVWLGLDHSYMREGPPIIFETMTFGEGEYNGMTWRYRTAKAAEIGHSRVVRAMRDACRIPLHLAKPHKTRNRHWR